MGKGWKIRSFVWVLVVALVFLGIPLYPGRSVQAMEYGTAKISNVQGEVSVKRSGGLQEFGAFDGMSLTQGDWVRTGEDGFVTLQYENGTETSLDANTEIIIQKLTSQGESGQTTIKLLAGAIWNKVKNLFNIGDQYEVETPTSVLGVRGTLYHVSQDNRTGSGRGAIMEGRVLGQENKACGIGRTQHVFTGQELELSDNPDQKTQIQPINQELLIAESQPRMLSLMLKDMAERHEELLQLAQRAVEEYQTHHDTDMLRLALVLADQSKTLASLVGDFALRVEKSSKAEAVDQLLKRDNLTLEGLKKTFETSEYKSSLVWAQIQELLRTAGFSAEDTMNILNEGLTPSLAAILKDLAKGATPVVSGGASGGPSGSEGSAPPVVDPTLPADAQSSAASSDNGDKTATITVEVKNENGVAITDLTASDFTVKLRGLSYVVADTPTLQNFTNQGNGVYTITFNPGFAVNEVVEILVEGISIERNLSVIISEPGGENPPPIDPTLPADTQSSAASSDNGDKTATITVEVKNENGETITDLTASDFTVKLRGLSYVVADTPTLQNFTNQGNGVYTITFNPGFAVNEVVEILVEGISIERNLSVIISEPGGGNPPPVDLETQPTLIEGGDEHSLALQSDGTVLAWGTNFYGQLGNAETPTSLDPSFPDQVSALTDVVSVSAGSYHSLALKADGTVWGWGRNDEGQLGGEGYKITSPVQIPDLTHITAVAAGALFSMALKDDGTVWSWGNNSYGQLGNGSTDDSNIPVQVSGLTDVIAIAAGEDHAVAVMKDGTVWSWGNNSHGQSGTGYFERRKVTEPVQAVGLSGVKAVAAGYAHTLALKEDGTVWAWGLNGCGQLGQWDDPYYGDRGTPTQVAGLEGVTAIAAGWEWSLAIKNGRIFAWGDNNYGQLGDGTEESKTSIVQVQNLSQVKGVSAGKEHSLAILEDNSFWGWGRNNKGQLGVSVDESSIPIEVGTSEVPVATISDFQSTTYTDITAAFSWTAAFDASSIKIQQSIDAGATWMDSVTGGLSPESNAATVQGLTPLTMYSFRLIVTGGQFDGESNRINLMTETPSYVVKIAAGSAFSMALKDNGTVWSWGYGGRLGDGNAESRAVPVMVKDLTNAIDIAAGDGFGMAIRDDQTAVAWGANEWGQLGTYTSYSTLNTPVKVELSDIQRLAGGMVHSLGIKTDGTVWTWGRNAYGALGIGVADDDKHYVPDDIEIKNDLGDPLNIVDVAGGENHSVALTSQGTVWTWGWNSSGQLGYETDGESFLPVEVPDLGGVAAVAAGKNHTLVLKDNGTVWAWGVNTSGQLGDNTQINRSHPIQVANLDNVVAIAAGDTFSVALKNDSTVWVWGINKTSKTLGIGNKYGSLVPAQVLTSEDGSYFAGVAAIAAGNNHLLAFRNDGSVWMWGIENLYGTEVIISYPQMVSGFQMRMR